MNDTTTATPAPAASLLVEFSTEQGTDVYSRKRSRAALPEQSTLELMIASMLPLPDKGGRPVICCLDFGINYYERQGK